MMIIINQDSDIIFFLVGFLVVLLVIFISYYYGKKNVILRELKKTDKKPIHRIQQNEYVKIIGKATGGNKPLIAPISGRKCLCYYVLVEKKGNKHWHEYIVEERFQDFFLDNQGERAIIKPRSVHFDFRKLFFEIDHQDSSGTFNDAKPNLERFLKKHGKESEGIFGFNKTLRYREGIIEVGETIAIKGVAEWKTLKEPIEGYSYSKILTLKGTANKKLIITDYHEATRNNSRKL